MCPPPSPWHKHAGWSSLRMVVNVDSFGRSLVKYVCSQLYDKNRQDQLFLAQVGRGLRSVFLGFDAGGQGGGR